MDFVSLLDQHACIQPDKECLRLASRAWTYAELADLTRRAATVLRAQGIGPGDKVALLCFNSPGFVIAMFGAWRLGAAVVPVNHKLQAPEIDYMLAHSGARLCVFDGTLAAQAERITHRCGWIATENPAEGMPLLEDLLTQAEPLADAPSPAGDVLAQVLYTSGTTGKPKGCLHSHQNVFMSAVCTAAGMSLSRN